MNGATCFILCHENSEHIKEVGHMSSTSSNTQIPVQKSKLYDNTRQINRKKTMSNVATPFNNILLGI